METKPKQIADVPLEQIQMVLEHKGITTTERYAEADLMVCEEENCEYCGSFGSEDNPVGQCGQCGAIVCLRCNDNYETSDTCHHSEGGA